MRCCSPSRPSKRRTSLTEKPGLENPSKTPLPQCLKPAWKSMAVQTNMEMSQRLQNQWVPPPDPRHATRRARQQPRTGVTGAIRGSCQQPRTGMRQAIRGNSKSNITMNICSYNPRTINDRNSHALDTMLQEISNVNWDIVGLSETKTKECKIEIIEGQGHKLFLSGNNTSRSNGVGFLIKKTHVPLVENYEPISDRLAILSLKGKFTKMHFIQCYFPTTTHPDDEVNELYEQIQTIVNDIPKRDHLFIMGDFNCKLGNLHTTYPNSIGKHTTGNYNPRGELLAKFCASNNLVVTNTLFQKRKLFTWTSPDGKTKNQIDFILTRKPSIRQRLLDSSVLNVPDISDHKMVRTKIRLSFSWPKRTTHKPKYDLAKLLTKDKQPFELKLSNRFASLSPDLEPKILLKDITTAILETAKETLPLKNPSKPDWMSTTTKQAIEAKHRIRKDKGDSSKEYKIAKAETKKTSCKRQTQTN